MSYRKKNHKILRKNVWKTRNKAIVSVKHFRKKKAPIYNIIVTNRFRNNFVRLLIITSNEFTWNTF